MIPKTLETAFLNNILSDTAKPSRGQVKAAIARAGAKQGLDLAEVGCLANMDYPDLLEQLFETAARIKQEIYGERLVFFAPLYISDYCVNDCAYCNFHVRNSQMARRVLTMDEIAEQTKFLINLGHKRVLLELGEDPLNNGIDYVTKAIAAIYSVRTPKGNIRRVNVNIAATTVADYKKLRKANIGTYQLFQETYHRPTYEKLHKVGPKADYARQLTGHLRAIEAGLDDVGLGVLFGLYDWRFEALGMVAHAQYLDRTCQAGPHTLSVPRFCQAPTVDYKPEYPVSDADFLKLIAILRLAVPYTGMIISTRESPAIRHQAFKIGISQASAGSVTTTGGYGKGQPPRLGRDSAVATQFTIHDERPLEEVINSALDAKFLPSFCTACYRSGRTGHRFMDLAKPGQIHKLCRPNAILTFAEYLADFSKPGLAKKGNGLIKEYLGQIEDPAIKKETLKRLESIAKGKRDIYF
ncbi:MAG: [FeFe] hydrogenase H-cluster radical SAM maturase HydG [Planctomycetota bacterium]